MGYPGLTYIGSGKISGLYGLNEAIHDQKSIGLQHLYVDNYECDLVYSATSVVKVDDTCYFGDRIKPLLGHSIKQQSSKSYTEAGFVFIDEFEYENFKKTDRIYCPQDYILVFNCEVDNKSNVRLEFDISALVITTKNVITCKRNKDILEVEYEDKSFAIKCFDEELVYRLSKESPSGFTYHGIQDLLFDENRWNGESMDLNGSGAISVSKKVYLNPGEKYTLKWIMDFKGCDVIDIVPEKTVGINYWNNWLKQSKSEVDDKIITNLIALKAVNMNGFLPADLTGHYFASDDIAFYVRDALHGAKAFMMCGFFAECKQIVQLIMNLERKVNNELYQRYNSRLEPKEGANNNVFSQIDVIGYLLSITVDYLEFTGELLIEIEDLMKEVNILDTVSSKNGLYGPEGGVNEGVYGPAYITSTNIFIAAGLNRLLFLLKKRNVNADYQINVQEKLDALISAINGNFLEEGYFAYGYVDYHDELVKCYDTPQLFGAGLGYPIDEKYRENFKTLSRISTYFDFGYGYSEQQYHDGPWLFNTCYAAQNAYLMKDPVLYDAIIEWIENHKNDYGLLPEAIDARNENRSYINPLMWANAEYISAKQVHRLDQLRNGDRYDNKN